MRAHVRGTLLAVTFLVLLGLVGKSVRADGVHPLNPLAFPNDSGVAATLSLARSIDFGNAFFRSLGTNARSCGTCHQPSSGWTLTPAVVRARFDATGGLDPLFHTHDGATTPGVDISTIDARRRAFALLLDRGLVRIGLQIPNAAEFVLVAAENPYGDSGRAELSVFRRPLPTTNLAFLATVMWDGRQTVGAGGVKAALGLQANRATLDHEGATGPLREAEQAEIVAFETGLFTAQALDRATGDLRASGARGGPAALGAERFYPGINPPVGADPSTGQRFDNRVFTLFDAWVASDDAGRRAVAHGQQIFNTRAFGGGLTCSTCHNTPNVGANSMGLLLNNGIADESRRTSDLPLYTFNCRSGPLIGRTFRTTDPGRALVTGRCVDIGSFKVPALRALATRPPYFHNGSATRLEDVVEFYEGKFRIGLGATEKADLVAFLRAL